MPDDKKGRVKINPKIVAEHKREQKEGYKGTVEDYYEEFYGPIPDGLEKGGMLKKPKKVSLGALIGIGADNLLKKSETARSLTKNLGIGGNLLGSYYDKKADTRDKTTGSEQTKQVTAKRMGGMIRGGRAEIKGTRPAKLS